MPYIDLTHTVTSAMPVFPGDPQPKLTQIASLEKEGYTDFELTTGMHVGTHIDAPLHFVANGKRLSEYTADTFFGKGHLIDARKKSIGPELLKEKIISPQDIVLVMTGWSTQFGTAAYYETYPEIEEEFAKELIRLGVTMVGMDTPSPDRDPYLIHKLLLQNSTLIIENLTNLEALLPYSSFTVVALPPKFDTEAAPARVVAIAP